MTFRSSESTEETKHTRGERLYFDEPDLLWSDFQNFFYGSFGISIVGIGIAPVPEISCSLTRSLAASTVALITLMAICPVFARSSAVYLPGGRSANSNEPSG